MPRPVNFKLVTMVMLGATVVKVGLTRIPGCGANELLTNVVTKEGVGEKFTENTLMFGSNAPDFGLGVAKK